MVCFFAFLFCLYAAGATPQYDEIWVSSGQQNRTSSKSYLRRNGDKVEVFVTPTDGGGACVSLRKERSNGRCEGFLEQMESLGLYAETAWTFNESTMRQVLQTRAMVTALIPKTTQPIASINIMLPPENESPANINADIAQRNDGASLPTIVCRCCYNSDLINIMHFMFQGAKMGQGVFVQTVVEYADFRSVCVSVGRASYVGEVIQTYFSKEVLF